MARPSVRVLLALALAAVAAIALAACGSDSSSSSSTSSSSDVSSTSSQSSSSGAAAVDLADNSNLGMQILVDDEGRTLYMFEKDDEPDESYCSGACASAWPPLTTKGKAETGSGLDASKLTTFKRDDGLEQISYAGHPLYYYAEDEQPGDANGNGADEFGAEWYAMDSKGEAVEDAGAADDSGGDSSTSADDSGSGETSTDDTGGGYSPY